MKIIHSSDLGWAAGQDISDEFAALAKTLQPGDTFVFDHMYEISGTNIQLANNVTLAGGAPGAGFEIQDFDQHNQPLLDLGDSNVLLDLTITHKDVPKSAEEYNGASIYAFGDNIQIVNCSFEGKPKEFVRAGGDSLSVVDTVFDGSYYQMRWFGEATNFTVENSLFQNSEGDGIKSARSGDGVGTENATIINSVFLNNKRDGIDTTGGFKDSSVIDSYFVGNGVSGMDIKAPIKNENDLSLDQVSRNITITGSEFIDTNKGLVLTTNDKAQLLTNKSYYDWVPQDIYVTDSIFENPNEASNAMVLAKGTTGVYIDNVTVLGRLNEFKIDNDPPFLGHLTVDLNTNLNVTNPTYGNPRPTQPDSYYESLAGPDWSNISYPIDGTPTPIDSVVDPDPIVYQPEPPVEADPVDEARAEPDPVVEAPVSDSTPVNSASDLLDIFVAYTDTDETISQLGAGSNIDSNIIDGRSLTIYATSQDGGPEIGSVKLTVDGVGSKIENAAPYALFGDKKGDFLGGEKLAEGSYTAELIVFSGKNGMGDVLETVLFNFTVDDAASTQVVRPTEPVAAAPVVEAPVEEEPVAEAPIEVVALETDLAPDLISRAPESKLLDIKLFDTSTDEALFDLQDGAKLSSGDLAGRKITLSAEAISSDASIGSVKLEIDGQYSRVESVEPFALFGDRNGDFKGGIELTEGTHFATLTAYSGKNGDGSVLEQVTVSFEVGDYDSVLIDGDLSTVSSYSEIQDTGYATVSKDQSTIELEGSAWKSVDLFEDITKDTVLKFDFKSDAEGEIQGIGFINKNGFLETTFFQLDGSQELGIQEFNDAYETGSGFKSYIIPVGEYFTGSVEQLVLVSDDDADLGAMSTFSNIGLIEGIA